MAVSRDVHWSDKIIRKSKTAIIIKVKIMVSFREGRGLWVGWGTQRGSWVGAGTALLLDFVNLTGMFTLQ